MSQSGKMGDTPHLLLVDDERSIREPLAAISRPSRASASPRSRDAEAARTRLAAYAIDLVVLDIMMPGEDGLSLCRHIRATSETSGDPAHRHEPRRPTASSGWKWAPTIMS